MADELTVQHVARSICLALGQEPDKRYREFRQPVEEAKLGWEFYELDARKFIAAHAAIVGGGML